MGGRKHDHSTLSPEVYQHAALQVPTHPHPTLLLFTADVLSYLNSHFCLCTHAHSLSLHREVQVTLDAVQLNC